MMFRGLPDETDEVIALLQDEAVLVDRGWLNELLDSVKLVNGKHSSATKAKVERLLAKA